MRRSARSAGTRISVTHEREHLNSGFLLVNQVECYKDKEKRLTIAKELIGGAAHNILSNLKYYRNRKQGLEGYIADIETKLPEMEKASDILELMAWEGKVRERYSDSFNVIMSLEEEFTQRTT